MQWLSDIESNVQQSKILIAFVCRGPQCTVLPCSPAQTVQAAAVANWWLQNCCVCRAAYPKVSSIGDRLVEILHSRPEQKPVDMSEACMCETIDALGLAGFNKAFHSIEAINQDQRADILDVSCSLLHVKHQQGLQGLLTLTVLVQHATLQHKLLCWPQLSCGLSKACNSIQPLHMYSNSRVLKLFWNTMPAQSAACVFLASMQQEVHVW